VADVLAAGGVLVQDRPDVGRHLGGLEPPVYRVTRLGGLGGSGRAGGSGRGRRRSGRRLSRGCGRLLLRRGGGLGGGQGGQVLTAQHFALPVHTNVHLVAVGGGELGAELAPGGLRAGLPLDAIIIDVLGVLRLGPERLPDRLGHVAELLALVLGLAALGPRLLVRGALLALALLFLLLQLLSLQVCLGQRHRRRGKSR